MKIMKKINLVKDDKTPDISILNSLDDKPNKKLVTWIIMTQMKMRKSFLNFKKVIFIINC